MFPLPSQLPVFLFYPAKRRRYLFVRREVRELTTGAPGLQGEGQFSQLQEQLLPFLLRMIIKTSAAVTAAAKAMMTMISAALILTSHAEKYTNQVNYRRRQICDHALPHS